MRARFGVGSGNANGDIGSVARGAASAAAIATKRTPLRRMPPLAPRLTAMAIRWRVTIRRLSVATPGIEV